MAAKIGTSNVLFRVGSGSPSKVYRGNTAVQDVPFFSGGSPFLTAEWSGTDTFVEVSRQGLQTYGLPVTDAQFFADSDEETPLTPLSLGINAFSITAYFAENLSDDAVRVSVANAIGFGPPSDWQQVSA